LILNISEDNSKSLSDTVKIGAFVANKQYTLNEESSHGDIPFSSLLMLQQTSSPPLSLTTEIGNTIQLETASGKIIDISNGNERLIHDNITPKYNSQNGSRRSSCSTSANEDFIMVDLVIKYYLLLK
jgi:hypothetical protein